MVDPDVADAVNGELNDIIAGNVEKSEGVWTTASGRRFGEHGGTLFPMDGPGVTNINRMQHQLIKELNNKGLDGAKGMMDALKNKGILSDAQIKQATELWKKCRK